MSRWPNKYIIGLTGNIATGKSVVRQMLQHSGAYTVDADSLAHQAMMPGAPAYKPIISTFGQVIVGPDGRIDRAALARIVFSNPDSLKKLEDITHPIIRQAIMALVGRAKQRVIVIEAIKLLEGELKDMVDAVWVVNATPQTQYRRLIEKRRMTEEEAKHRMLSQGKQTDKVRQAHVVIDNDGNVENTWKQVQTQWSEIKQKLVTPASAGGTATPGQTPVQEAELEPDTSSIDISGIIVKRGMPSSAQTIADFISDRSGRQVTRMDIMLNFGQKSYLIAQDQQAGILALMGWTVENLVTSMDEFHLAAGASIVQTVHAMVVALEEASKELESEVGFMFLPQATSQQVLTAFKADGYEQTSLKEIKIPAWREAIEQGTSQGDMLVLWKQLRKDRVLQPI